MPRDTIEEAAGAVADPVVATTERVELLEGESDPLAAVDVLAFWDTVLYRQA